MLPVFSSDMRTLKKRDPNIWSFILDGHFSVKINHIPGTAKRGDHASEKQKSKTKN